MTGGPHPLLTSQMLTGQLGPPGPPVSLWYTYVYAELGTRSILVFIFELKLISEY